MVSPEAARPLRPRLSTPMPYNIGPTPISHIFFFLKPLTDLLLSSLFSTSNKWVFCLLQSVVPGPSYFGQLDGIILFSALYIPSKRNIIFLVIIIIIRGLVNDNHITISSFSGLDLVAKSSTCGPSCFPNVPNVSFDAQRHNPSRQRRRSNYNSHD